MTNYHVIKEDGIYDVYETQTKLTISTHNSSQTASAFAKSLNLGKGFDGRTPEFFVNSGPLHLA